MEVYQIDLPAWLAARRYRAVLELIDELPQACRLQEAILNDPEQAQLILADELARDEAELLGYVRGVDVDPDDLRDTSDEEDQAQPLWRPRLRDWDTAAIQRAAIHAQLVALNHNTVRAANGKPGTPQYLPAPRTLVDDLRDSQDRTEALAVMAIVAPHALDLMT